MKLDFNAQVYLWNRGGDGLIRVLQRLRAFSVCTKQQSRACEVRPEEIRAGLYPISPKLQPCECAPMKIASFGRSQHGKRVVQGIASTKLFLDSFSMRETPWK